VVARETRSGFHPRHPLLPLFGVASPLIRLRRVDTATGTQYRGDSGLLFFSLRSTLARTPENAPASSCPSRVVTWREVEFPDDHPVVPRSVWLPDHSAESKPPDESDEYAAKLRAALFSWRIYYLLTCLQLSYRLINASCKPRLPVKRHPGRILRIQHICMTHVRRWEHRDSRSIAASDFLYSRVPRWLRARAMCNRSVCFYKNKIPGCVTRGKACPLPRFHVSRE